MKYTKIFLASAFLMIGCQKSTEEEMIDLDRMALSQQEDQHIAQEPLESPQETLIKESMH